MLPDELCATMNDRIDVPPDRQKEADTGKSPKMTRPPLGEQDRMEQRRDPRWTAASPELPDGFIHPMDVFRPRTDADQSPSSPFPRSSQRDSQPGMPPSEVVTASTKSIRTSTPNLRQGQLAFSAMQFLPVPLLVLSSLKRVVLANEAMGRLLGIIQQPAEEGDMGTLDRIRGLSLSQLGMEVVQDGRIASFDWELYLDSLITLPDAEKTAHDGSDIDLPHGDDRDEVSGADGVDTEFPEKVSQRPGQTGVVEVFITRNINKLPSDSIPRAETATTQHRAKVVVNPFQVNNQQTYFNLAFTDIKTSSSPTLHPTWRKSVAGTRDEVPAGVSAFSDHSNIEQMINRMKEQDEVRFRTMCDVMPQLVWTTTPEGDLEFFNQRWYGYTGLTPDASMGHAWTRAVHPDDVAESEKLFQQSLKTGEPFQTEYRCRSKEGEWNWFVVRALPFRSKETGKIERWLGTCTYANESIESNREVERTWQQLLTVISHAQVTVFQVDTQRRVTLLEGALVEEVLGGHEFNSRWYGGRDMYEVFKKVAKKPGERQQRFLGPIETILAGYPHPEILQDDEFGKLSGLDLEDTHHRTPATDYEAEGRFYRTRFLPIGVKDQDGLVRATNVEGVIGVIRDVTELKSKEADILRQGQEKQQLMASEAAAKEASKLKSQFLANMSHEIRTPITGVIGMAELLLDLELGDEQREFTENIYRSANALLTVINDILDFSKVESGHLDIEEVQFSLSVIVRDVDKMLSFAAQRKNLDFSSDISDDIANDLVVMGDPGRVRQIITNLLTNSIKFTNQGHVKFTVLKESETEHTIEIKFVIEDTGIGIEEEVRKRLFVPFSQGDASTARKFGGTGLGLTICKSLLDLMHGRITLESTIGSGTTATFWIPFKKPGSADTDLVRIDPLSDRLQSEMSVSGNSSEPDGLLGSIPPELASSGLVDGLMPSRSHHRNVSSSNVTPSSVTPTMEEISQAERANIHILVVEDNAINQQIATKTIKKLGFNVSAAWNGKEALDYLAAAQEGKQRKPNVILMDVQMPVIDGYKCTHLLRYHLPYKAYVQDVPIVAMTASAIQGDREKCRKAGMDDYLAKPVRGKVLEQMLVRWTARKRSDVSKYSSHGSEISEVECSNDGEHCDSADIPCVEHDDGDFLDLRQPPLDDLRQHPIDAMLPFMGSQQYFERSQAPQRSTMNSRPPKPPLTRSDTEETQLVRKQVTRNDSAQTTKRTTSKTSNETDGEMAAQSRDAKLFDAAGAGPEQIPSPHRPSPEPAPGSGGGEALTEANMEKHMKEEEDKLWHSHGSSDGT
jgi:PAS domain S-box-containing protein